jgi:excinuclease ABC subunit C
LEAMLELIDTIMVSDLINELLRQLPASPGVYLMRNARGNILYVGKAVNLRNRVRSYFNSPAKLDFKTSSLVEQVHDFEYFVVSSEQEALILELNLIKRYWPPFNVLLKDDKTFPYLKIQKGEDWPRLHITRRLENDGSKYFGPFASISTLRRTVDVLKRIFPLRSCTIKIDPAKNTRPCLKYHLGYCLAPCAGQCTPEDYANVLDQVVLFFEGKTEQIVRQLKKKMESAAEAMDYERAARFRDQLQAVQEVLEGQRIAMKVQGEQDAIAYAADKDQACVQVFMIRHGRLIGRESFTLKGVSGEKPSEILGSFIKQFYAAAPYIPPLLLISHPIEDQELIENWLSQKREGRVRLEAPQKGKKKQLIEIAAENARQGLEQLKIKQLAPPPVLSEALAEIQKALNLPALPARIEGYDISNIQGSDAVGSLIVFDNGKPKPGDYRRFKIKTVEGANDFAMLQEMLRRRFKRANSDEPEKATWKILPDLVLIDGGKGQLNAAREVMEEAGMTAVPLASLAKENEELYLPGRTSPIVLPKSSNGLKLLQRLRDEAHRFAIGYFQKLHHRRVFVSSLDAVTGIGPKRKKALLKQFGTVQGIREASLEELSRVKGVNRVLALHLKEAL